MSMSLSAAGPSYGAPSLTPTVDEILAQNAKVAAEVAPEEVGSVDPAQAPVSSDPALGNNLDISV
ncbi:MAG: hypothetical protein CFE28_01160 [Alphaproteobacteria bacterium PA2]|nr:MAG: hypothetical protein CFE28_01160 [Alphaproteobacteria bacterium PA2]